MKNLDSEPDDVKLAVDLIMQFEQLGYSYEMLWNAMIYIQKDILSQLNNNAQEQDRLVSILKKKILIE